MPHNKRDEILQMKVEMRFPDARDAEKTEHVIHDVHEVMLLALKKQLIQAKDK